jgi:hypothetical protein
MNASVSRNGAKRKRESEIKERRKKGTRNLEKKEGW